MKQGFLFSLCILALGACQNKTNDQISNIKLDGSEIWIDVRTPKEYSDDHVMHAQNWEHQTAVDSIRKYHPELDKKIFLYCRSGNRASQVETKLIKLGYRNLTNIQTLKAGKKLTNPFNNLKQNKL
jgi:phage shock protein E